MIQARWRAVVLAVAVLFFVLSVVFFASRRTGAALGFSFGVIGVGGWWFLGPQRRV